MDICSFFYKGFGVPFQNSFILCGSHPLRIQSFADPRQKTFLGVSDGMGLEEVCET